MMLFDASLKYTMVHKNVPLYFWLYRQYFSVDFYSLCTSGYTNKHLQ